MIGDAAVTDTEYHHLIYFCFRRIVSDSKVLRQSYIIHTTTLEACRARFCELCILVNGIASSLTFRVYILWTYHRFGSVTAQNQPTHAFCLSFAMFLQQSYDHMVRVCSCFGRATRPTNRRLPRTSSNFSWVARKKRTTAWRSTANTSTQPSTNSPLTSWRAKDSTSKSRIPLWYILNVYFCRSYSIFYENVLRVKNQLLYQKELQVESLKEKLEGEKNMLATEASHTSTTILHYYM